MKKYELVKTDTLNYNGIVLYRIRALKNFASIKVGDFGGYIEKEINLSHEDNSWVYGNAQVFGSAKVFGSAWVYGNARVYGNAQVYGNAHVSDSALVSGDALVYANALVYGNAKVSGDAKVSSNAQVYGNALVSGNAKVSGDARVFGDAQVSKYGECITITNQKNNITLTPNLIIIGCKTWKTLEEFENTYKQVGKDNGYTDDESELTAELVRIVMKRFKPIVSEIEVEHNGTKYKFDLNKAKELGVIK